MTSITEANDLLRFANDPPFALQPPREVLDRLQIVVVGLGASSLAAEAAMTVGAILLYGNAVPGEIFAILALVAATAVSFFRAERQLSK